MGIERVEIVLVGEAWYSVRELANCQDTHLSTHSVFFASVVLRNA